MKGLKTTKRLIAAVLSLVMMLGMLPVIPLSINAAGTDGTSNFVSLPITIRDYASDGMLFECNELGKYNQETYTHSTSSAGSPDYDFYANGFDTYVSGTSYAVTQSGGVYTFTANNTSSGAYIYTNSVSGKGMTIKSLRYVAIRYRIKDAVNTNVPLAVQNSAYATVKSVNLTADNTWRTAVIDCGSSTTELWRLKITPHLNKGGYVKIDYLAGFDTQADAQAYIDNGGQVIVTNSTTYNLGNTLGYGLLATDGDAWLNDLPANGGIAGTTLIQNGSWNGQTDPTVMTQTLSSGATQILHGAYIRTDLVADKLAYDANGKPQLVYTEATVNYLANYMAKTLAQPQKTNGNYNMWYVMGYKHESLGGKDLATVLREKATGGLGSYAETVKKASELTGPDALNYISTFTDAAYFLLHNLYNDQTGYGKTVDQYTTLNLVQKTANGKTYYTFNSAYDNVIYGTDGVIKNSQTSTITQRKSYTCSSYNSTSYTEEDWYVRGNIQPFYSFNPVGNYGYGYAASRDTYRDFCEMYQINKDNTSQNEYYDKVNFHYTLEGHAEFIYHADDELYFIFTGDDDVYLYINGVRVLDAGGAHAISRVEVNLNDVAEMCGLHDGEIYKFDFYYMERHGSSANFGIETNIKIVDPAMVTEKRAWQNDNLVGYNGYVLPDVDIVYDFSITNNGETSIGDLTFLDENLGVSLSKDAIVLPYGTSIKDIAAYHFAADGSVKAFTNPADMTKDILKSYLAAETPETKLQVGEKLMVYGFKHKLGNNDADVFDNYVYTTAVADGENVDDAKRNLNGMDNHRVQKTHYAFESLEFYDGGHLDGVNYGQLDENKSQGVTITRDELLAPMKAKEDLKNLNYSKATIALTNASGTSTSVKYNATIQADGSIFFQTGKVGTELFYYTVTVGEYTYEPIAVHVHTYGVDDSIFVLDYNLPVELFENTAHIARNDILTLNSNVGTSYSFNTPASKVGTYGDFTAADGSLIYTMKQFLNGLDSIEVEVTVLKNGATAVDKTTGVVLTQTVSVAPANVMYYEDDFGSLNYINKGTDENGNIWVVYDSPDKMGYQSSDQSENYGYDSGYSMFLSDMLMFNPEFVKDADPDKLQAILDELFHGPKSDWDNEDNNPDDFKNYIPYPGGVLYGDASNDSIHLLKVNSTTSEAVLSFEFVGTGFEILSRTTWNETYAVLTVRLDKKDENGEWKFDQAIPVISESIGGDLTQIPLVVMKDLAYGEYQVTVLASNYREQTRLFFVDGIRVYQPLTDEQEALYYKADEKNVTFTEIKTEISQGNIVYGTVSPNLTADEMVEYIQSWGFGDTMIENRGDDKLVLIGTSPKDKEEKQLTPYEQYMYYGPNNEIYLSTANGCALSYIAFYVTKDESYVGERSIQVGAHLKYTTDNPDAWDPNGMNFVSLMYGDTALNFADPSYRYSVGSGTEQYFSINLDFSKPCIENGVEKYLVIIGTDDANRNVLALTNIKLNGYTILGGGTAAAELTVLQDVSDINASHMAAETYGLIKRYVAKNN